MVSFGLRVITSLLITFIALSPASICANCKECGKDESKKYIYDQLRMAVFDSLPGRLNATDTLARAVVARIGTMALETEVERLKQVDLCQWKCGDGHKAFARFLFFITYPQLDLVLPGRESIEAVVHVYLRDLFREPGCEIYTDPNIIDNISGYRVLAGGNWVDTDQNSTDGEFMAGVHVRTRLKDWRVPHKTIKLHRIGTLPEGKFLDVIIDGTLIDNSTVYEVTDSSAGGISRDASKSSNVSLALYFVPWKYRFADLASLGALLRFQFSSLENSSDNFRRLVFGIRAESRGDKARIRNSYIEIGLTANSVPGSFQLNKIAGVERIVINTNLGLLSGKYCSAFVRFHGEWTIRQARRYTTDGFDSKKEQTLPVYEFGFAAAIDPLKILGL